MANNRRNFLKKIIGTAVATPIITEKVFANELKPEILKNEFESILGKEGFNCVIAKNSNCGITYKAVKYKGSEKLQPYDIVVWKNEEQHEIEFYDRNSKGKFAGTVIFTDTSIEDYHLKISEREKALKEYEEKQWFI